MKILKIIIGLLLLSSTIGGWFLFKGDGNKIEFRIEKITRGSIKAQVSATGTLNPVQLVTVGSQVSGKVNKLYAKVNDHVKVGELLAEIDPALLLAQIKQDNSSLENAKVSYEQSRRDLERDRMLLAKDFIAKHDLELAEQSYLQNKNSYDAVKTVIERDVLNLNYAKILSPIDGVIIAQSVTEGQTLQASFATPDLFKIAGNLSDMKIDVNFSESDISKVKVGMPTTFTVNAFPQQTFTGKVETVNFNPSSQSGQGGVTYNVVVTLKNANGNLLPGMTAYVSVILSERKNVLRVPLSALRFTPPQEQTSEFSRIFGSVSAKPALTVSLSAKDDKKNIYLLRDHVLTPVSVKTGATDEAYIEVSGSNIAEGDSVVIGIKKIKKL